VSSDHRDYDIVVVGGARPGWRSRTPAWLKTGTHSADAVRSVLAVQGALTDFTPVDTSAS
jgi:hypothetical protein